MSESTVRGSTEREPTTVAPVEVSPRGVDAHHDDDIPRMEPWLGMVMASFLPVLIAFLVPRTYMAALLVASGVLFVAAMVMLIGQQGRKRRRDSQP
jgi:hypothetical protein